MYLLMIILINLTFAQAEPDDLLSVTLKYDNFQVLPDNIYLLDGELTFYNNSSEIIELPKSFDLKIILTDSLNNKVPVNPNKTFEYHNLIISKKAMKIFPHSEIKYRFAEWRLVLYKLKPNTKYIVHYILETWYYPVLNNKFHGKQIITNEDSFIFPDKIQFEFKN
jgi:hypothetical protein